MCDALSVYISFLGTPNFIPYWCPFKVFVWKVKIAINVSGQIDSYAFDRFIQQIIKLRR